MDIFSLSPYSLPPLISSVLFLLLGAAVYLKNRKSNISVTYFLISFVTFWWQFSWFILFNSQNEALASYMVKIGYMGIIFIPVFFYHFFLAFLNKIKGSDKYFLYFSYFLSFVFIALLWTTDHLVQGYYEYFWGFYPKTGSIQMISSIFNGGGSWLSAGLAHLLFLSFLTLVSIKGIHILMKSFFEERKENPAKASQIKYITIAFLIYFLAASDFVVNYGVEFYPFGFLFILCFLTITAYAITKYQLFEVKVILTESLVGTMAVALLAEILLFQTLWTRAFGVGVFLFFCAIGYSLVKYTYREVGAKEEMERKVQERTEELEQSKKVAEDRAQELEKWYKLTIGRELKMAELKGKIKEMEDKK